jgi:hypothetical protein
MRRALLMTMALLLIPLPAQAAKPAIGQLAPNAQIQTVQGDKFDLTSCVAKWW